MIVHQHCCRDEIVLEGSINYRLTFCGGLASNSTTRQVAALSPALILKLMSSLSPCPISPLVIICTDTHTDRGVREIWTNSTHTRSNSRKGTPKSKSNLWYVLNLFLTWRITPASTSHYQPLPGATCKVVLSRIFVEHFTLKFWTHPTFSKEAILKHTNNCRLAMVRYLVVTTKFSLVFEQVGTADGPAIFRCSFVYQLKTFITAIIQGRILDMFQMISLCCLTIESIKIDIGQSVDHRQY